MIASPALAAIARHGAKLHAEVGDPPSRTLILGPSRVLSAMTLNKIRSGIAGLLILASAWILASAAEAGSSCQYITTGAVLTAAQWNACFAAKIMNSAIPINKAGDGMTGLLTTPIAPTVSTAGFRLYPGVAPSAPTNGDLWTTSAGLYVPCPDQRRTVGPLTASAAGSFAATSPLIGLRSRERRDLRLRDLRHVVRRGSDHRHHTHRSRSRPPASSRSPGRQGRSSRGPAAAFGDADARRQRALNA